MNIYDIIKRVKISCGYTSDAELARALNMSPQNFLSQKKTGKIKDSLMVHAIERGVNIEWIKTGVGNMRTGSDNMNSVREQQQAYNGSPLRPSMPTPTSDLLLKTAQVLESESIYRTALKSNIEAFHHDVLHACRDRGYPGGYRGYV